jgi:hypothetical protein
VLVIFVNIHSVLSVAENPTDGTETTECKSILDLVYAGVLPYTLDQDDLARRNSWVDRGPLKIKLLGSFLGGSKQ